MTLLHDFILNQATQRPQANAVLYKDQSMNYLELAEQIERCASGLLQLGLGRGERVAVYLPKQMKTVISLFGSSMAGGVFVPVNPLLKPMQVAHIVKDCKVKFLITSASRASLLSEALEDCISVSHLILIDEPSQDLSNLPVDTISWAKFTAPPSDPVLPCHSRIDADVASILYTSGSTGNPKGVVLSHRNMVEGARSVAKYLHNSDNDRLLAVLPFSFDYGLSQLTSAFLVGASVILMDYLLPQDVIKAVVRYQATGLAAVPPLWTQLAQREWPKAAQNSLRYITNSGGAVPPSLSEALASQLPDTEIYLMYGLTEAFRSTYLPPDQVSIRPESIGKAIPNAEVMIVHEDGSPCQAGETGELIHRGALVSLGYWNDPEKTAIRFKPAPGQPPELVNPELAVWSGDQVKMDEAGYLYFVGREDEMIKTSGYRVSPNEVEDVVFASKLADQITVIGVPHTNLGQAIVLLVEGTPDDIDPQALLQYCKQNLPAYMVPMDIAYLPQLPRNANGKIDRASLTKRYQRLFNLESA